MTLLNPQPVDFDDTWVLLESSLITILQDIGQGFPPDLWMLLYTGIYKLCTKQMDPQHSKLYARLKVLYVLLFNVPTREVTVVFSFNCYQWKENTAVVL